MWPYPAFSEYARWTKEKDRKICALDMQGRKVGFGSWFNRQYDNYTCEEYYVAQYNKDCVRTVELTPEDRLNHELKDDDSLKASDWRERTGTGQPLLRMGEVSSDI